MIRRPPRSTRKESSAASDVYKRQARNRPSVAARTSPTNSTSDVRRASSAVTETTQSAPPLDLISGRLSLCQVWWPAPATREANCGTFRTHPLIRGEGGKLPPYGWTSKNYVICVCFHCHGTSSYHTTNTNPYKFPMHCSKCVSFWETSYSRPPIDPYLTSPLLQNPGGATELSRS